ncbi:MAG TPA: hypothetical protein VF087_15530 [Solirubrobacteraceae bacterium]
MDAATARNVAHYSHHQQRDRRGEPIVEHVARVVAAVPPQARAVAWLHDVLEHSPTTTAELRRHGMTGVELDALDLLTRQPGESYELFILRISYAPGAAGRLARLIKLADLDDHLARAWEPGDPPYAWARRHIAVGRARIDYSSSRPSTRARATASERDDASSLR